MTKLPISKRRYLRIEFTDSNRAKRELQKPFTTSLQLIRDDANGSPLPKGYLRHVIGRWRSKYDPHVGKKQLAKLKALTAL